MGIFLVGSLLCGLAQSMGQLIAFRARAGCGRRRRSRRLPSPFSATSSRPASVAGTSATSPSRSWARPSSVPLVGGFIIDHYSWPWIFWVNVPFCRRDHRVPLRAAPAVPSPEAKLDYTGAALLSMTIGGLMIGLEVGGDGWTEPARARAVSVVAVVAARRLRPRRTTGRGADDPAAAVRQPGRPGVGAARPRSPASSPTAPGSSCRCTSRTRCSCRPPSRACGCCRR